MSQKVFLFLSAFLFLRTTLAIGSGELVKPNQIEAKSSVIVFGKPMEGSSELCTGILIAPQFVLTAGHCISRVTTDANESSHFNEVEPPNDVQVYFGNYDGLALDAKLLYSARAVFRHPNFTKETNWDVGLIQLAKRAPAPFKPAALLNDSSRLYPGQTLILAGFGTTQGYDQSREPKQRLLYRFRTLLRNPDDQSEDQPGQLQIYKSKDLPWLKPVFDSGDSATRSRIAVAGAQAGDSGGPAFVILDGQTLVAGTCSAQDREGYETYESIPRVVPWIEEILAREYIESPQSSSALIATLAYVCGMSWKSPLERCSRT